MQLHCHNYSPKQTNKSNETHQCLAEYGNFIFNAIFTKREGEKVQNMREDDFG